MEKIKMKEFIKNCKERDGHFEGIMSIDEIILLLNQEVSFEYDLIRDYLNYTSSKKYNYDFVSDPNLEDVEFGKFKFEYYAKEEFVYRRHKLIEASWCTKESKKRILDLVDFISKLDIEIQPGTPLIIHETNDKIKIINKKVGGIELDDYRLEYRNPLHIFLSDDDRKPNKEYVKLLEAEGFEIVIDKLTTAKEEIKNEN